MGIAVTGTEPRLGLHFNGGAHSAPAQSGVTPAAPRSSDMPAAPGGQPEQAAPRPTPPDAGTSATSAEPPQAAAFGAGELVQPPSSSSAPGSAPTEPAGQQPPDTVAQPDPLGLGRPVQVFSRQAVEKAETGTGCAVLQCIGTKPVVTC